jgi:hypothetical protein
MRMVYDRLMRWGDDLRLAETDANGCSLLCLTSRDNATIL